MIVVTEDDVVRAQVCRMLSEAGYRALPAADAEDSLRVAQRHVEPIGLVLADADFRGATTESTARRLGELHPKVKVAFMSHAAWEGRPGRLTAERRIIPKPLTAPALLSAVRQALDSPN